MINVFKLPLSLTSTNSLGCVLDLPVLMESSVIDIDCIFFYSAATVMLMSIICCNLIHYIPFGSEELRISICILQHLDLSHPVCWYSAYRNLMVIPISINTIFGISEWCCVTLFFWMVGLLFLLLFCVLFCFVFCLFLLFLTEVFNISQRHATNQNRYIASTDREAFVCH